MRAIASTLCALFLFAAIPAHGAVPQSERDALLALFDSTDGSAWTNKAGWGGAAGTECSWYGITCDQPGAHITRLALGDNNLTGTLPAQISGLPELVALFLQANDIGGTIPSSIGSLTKLTTLELSGNQISGPIPASVGDLSQLTFFSAYDNQLSGSIPVGFANLSKLENLTLGLNDLTGTISAELGNLSSLRFLVLNANELTGEIPASLGNLSALIELNLGDNNLTGTIPPALGSLAKLELLHLYDNQLSGQLPIALGQLTKLRSLVLHTNQFTGEIPPQMLSPLTSLVELNLRDNGLSGPIPFEIGNLTQLTAVELTRNQLSGPIPTSVGNLTKLEFFSAFENQLSGPIPFEFTTLPKLRNLTLGGNRLTGTIPASIGNATTLTHLILNSNQLTGEVPPSIWNLSKLQWLYLYANDLTGSVSPKIGEMLDLYLLGIDSNRLSGPIPDVFHNLKKLYYFSATDNEFTGPVPASFGQATDLEILHLSENSFSGSIPVEISTLPKLTSFTVRANQISGTIPSQLGNLSQIRYLGLGSNLLSGSLPSELGQLSTLAYLDADGNQLRGEVPATFTALTNASGINLGDNALKASNPAVLSFLESRGNFVARQTVPPANVKVDSVGAFTATLSWSPIAYSSEAGGYQVLAATSPGGPYSPLVTTRSKEISNAQVTGLSASTRYYFTIQTVTYPHGGSPNYQLSTIFSDPSAEVTAMTQPPSSTPASIIVTASPAGLVQTPAVGGATDSYTLTNAGGTATTITLGSSGSFFVQDPPSFTLEPGASQIVTLTGRPQPAGVYDGTSNPTGTGVPSGLAIPVRLVCAVPPSNAFLINALQNRVDLIAPIGVDPTGSLVFRNDGTGTFAGVASSDVQFLVPQGGLITIPPGATVTVSVTSLRAMRPDSAALSGTQAGNVSLVPIPGVGSGRSTNSGTSVSLVSVVDTVKPQTGATTVPPLALNEVALYLSSVGHVVGSVGEFLSDLSILNAYGASSIPDLKLYYTALGASSTSVANLSALGTSQAISLADVVKSVFGGTAEVGTIQIRSTRARNLSISASIFNSSNPAGNYGTSIPALRSDRSIVAGQSAFLTGLRKDSSGHANFYVQETRGKAATVSLEFLGADGSIIGATSASVAPFALARLLDPLTLGTVAVRLSVTGGEGAVAAYATPVDRVSGDTWAVADWALQYGYNQSESIVIPIAGAVRGANGTYFRTDVAITNRCATFVDTKDNPDLLRTTPCRGGSSQGVLRYYPTTGGVIERPIDLGLLQTSVMVDVVRTVFGIETDTIGHIVFSPSNGAFAATSRTYTIVEGSPATFGSSVPALGQSLALRRGQSRRIGALQDTTKVTIGKRTPATNRTNFGIVETSGEDVTVRVTAYLNEPRSLAAGQPAGTKTYQLRPRELVNVSGLLATILGEIRETRYADLNDVQVQFDVVSATGSILVYTSSVDNGTGDSLLRTE